MPTPQAYCAQLDLPAASRTRLLLQLCALQLAQEQGVEALRLQDVLHRAQVSKPAFYACFDSLESQWSTLAKELGAEVFATVSPLAKASLDPWTRIAICLRLHLHLAAKFPAWGNLLGQLQGRLVLLILESLGLHADKAKSLAFKRIPKPVTVGGMMFSYLSQQPASASTPASDAPAVQAAEQPTLWNRHSVSPKRLQEPAPLRAELESMLAAAMHAPDHGRLLPWRVIEFAAQEREPLAQLFEEEKLRRDPLASEQDRLRAREHATRPPMLLAFVVSLRAQTTVPSSEQWLSAGAALGNLLAAAHSLGFGAMVLSGDRCADATLRSRLGLAPEEHLAGFISLGSIREARPAQAERPTELVLSAWQASKQFS